MKKRVLAAFLAVFLVLGMLPGTARAEDDSSEEETVIHVSDPALIKESLAKKRSNVRLVLDGKDYVVRDIDLSDLKNVTIEGTEGTRIVCDSPYDTVLEISRCKGITLKNIVLGHDFLPKGGGCTMGVLKVEFSDDVKIINCDIFGCGLDGLAVTSSNIQMYDTTIRDCSNCIMIYKGGNALFQRCTFSGNGYAQPTDQYFGSYSGQYGIDIMGDDNTTLTFADCIFVDNKNPNFYGGGTAETATVTYDSSLFYNNAWGDDNVSTRPEIPAANDNKADAPNTPNIQTNVTLPSGVKYLPYAWTPENAAGTSSYTILSDALPSGLYVNPSTGGITGIPMAAGTWEFTIRQSGSGDSQTVDVIYTIEIQDNTSADIQAHNDYPITTNFGTPSDDNPNIFIVDSYDDRTMVIDAPFSEFRNMYIDGQKLTRDVDYTAYEGSTVSTILAETIERFDSGTHTIFGEFQDKSGNMKYSGQNYTVPLGTPKKSTGTKPGVSDGWPFNDVSAAKWYYSDVKWSYDGKVMTGVTATSFAPMTSISQATIVTVLSRMAGIDLTCFSGMSDSKIASGKWYTDAAIWAKQSGLLPDYNVFTGNETISRDQMAIMLVKYLRSMGKDTTPPVQPAAFADAEQMSADGNNAFQVLYAYNIFRGVGDGRMDPGGQTTRAQFAALVHRISDVL